MDPSVIFAWIIAVLAGLACIGALAVLLVAEWYAIRRTIERHRRPGRAELVDPSGRWWRERSALTAPERQP
jgi:O-antigen ligase